MRNTIIALISKRGGGLDSAGGLFHALGLSRYRIFNTIPAFTLAEVLITLGIIGVVAAMTLPTLINNYKKTEVTTHLKKFFSMMNQAILEEEAASGSMEYWMPNCNRSDKKCFENWYLEHLDKHIKSYQKKASSNDVNYNVIFADGSGFNAYVAGSTQIHFFYCTNFKYCNTEKERYDGVQSFLFTICKYKNKYQLVASDCNYQNKTREKLLDLCLKGNSDNADIYSQGRRHACTRLIQYDGWEIKDDYPWFQAKQPEKDK